MTLFHIFYSPHCTLIKGRTPTEYFYIIAVSNILDNWQYYSFSHNSYLLYENYHDNGDVSIKTAELVTTFSLDPLIEI